jgi:hypothetical protein
MTEQGSSRRTQFLLVLSPIGGQSTNGNPQPKPGTSFTGGETSLLLLTFSVSLLAVLASVLRMLLGIGRMLFALHVVIFPVLFGRGAMRLGGILVMFRCLIVSIFRHGIPPLSGDVIQWYMTNDWPPLFGSRPSVIDHIQPTYRS